MYRQYDAAMKEFLTRKMPNGFVVPIVGPVPPLRAFGFMRDVLKADPRVIKDDKFVPLPFVSFDRLDTIFAQDRYQGAQLRGFSYAQDGNSTSIADRPMPYDIPYSVEIWAEKEDDAIYLLEAFQRKWRRPMAYIKVWHGEPFGLYRIGIHPPQVVDNSTKTSDTGDRDIRFTLTMTVEAFMTFPAESIPTVRQVDTTAVTDNKPLSAPGTNDDETFIYSGEETE